MNLQPSDHPEDLKIVLEAALMAAVEPLSLMTTSNWKESRPSSRMRASLSTVDTDEMKPVK
jgi:hypothetical protein